MQADDFAAPTPDPVSDDGRSRRRTRIRPRQEPDFNAACWQAACEVPNSGPSELPLWVDSHRWHLSANSPFAQPARIAAS